MFSANLRLPEKVSDETKKKLVTNMINELGLKSCADTKVISVSFTLETCMHSKVCTGSYKHGFL
jgi:hypothetical protein